MKRIEESLLRYNILFCLERLDCFLEFRGMNKRITKNSNENVQCRYVLLDIHYMRNRIHSNS